MEFYISTVEKPQHDILNFSTVENPLDRIFNFYCGKPIKWYS